VSNYKRIQPKSNNPRSTRSSQHITGSDFLTLQISDNLRIAADTHNFKLQRRINSKSGPSERWRTFAYYGSICELLEFVKDLKIRRMGKCTPEVFAGLLLALKQDIREIGDRCVDAYGRCPKCNGSSSVRGDRVMRTAKLTHQQSSRKDDTPKARPSPLNSSTEE
jgi:hypothetical protein